jgi:hypothetical protein
MQPQLSRKSLQSQFREDFFVRVKKSHYTFENSSR